MTEDPVQQPNHRQLAKLLGVMLGPEEKWDDSAAELVLELHGIDSSKSKVRLKRIVDKLIQGKTERGEEVITSLRDLQSRLAADIRLR